MMSCTHVYVRTNMYNAYNMFVHVVVSHFGQLKVTGSECSEEMHMDAYIHGSVCVNVFSYRVYYCNPNALVF